MAFWDLPGEIPDLGVCGRQSRPHTPKSGLYHGYSQRANLRSFVLRIS